MTTLSGTDFDFVRGLIQTRAGLILEPEKAYLAESRLHQLGKESGLGTAADVIARLKAGRDPALSQKVVEAMTTNETSFFRDVHPFDALRKHLIPDLMKKRAADRKLYVWCGAASTGQEPYTLAMLLREHFPALQTWDVRILATDINAEVLAKAKAGRYTQLEVNRGLPAPLLVKYFQRQGTDWQLKDDVRTMVRYASLNLLDGRPDLPHIDLVMLRNVLIYFDVPTKRDILTRIRRWLRPDGTLMLGGAETTWNVDDGYERMTADRTTYYRPKAN